MKKIQKILLVVILVMLSLFSCAPKSKEAAGECEKSRYVYLVAGFDEVAENTDVLFTVSYDANTNMGYVAQIPRDTYYNFGKSQNKINQIYATLISEGKNPREALELTSERIEDLFGTKFDGFIGITVDTFKRLVDAIGGIDIELSEDITLYLDSEDEPIVLKQGMNHIDGEGALSFVRFRSGYAMGDLGRIDAQKLFLNGIFHKLSKGVSVPSMFKIANAFQNRITSNVKLGNLLSLYIDSLGSELERRVCYVTVPGEPLNSSEGVSYYVLNRKNAAEIAIKYMNATEDFDKNMLCRNDNESGFVNIYDDDRLGYREYTNENLVDMHIIQKNNFGDIK